MASHAESIWPRGSVTVKGKPLGVRRTARPKGDDRLFSVGEIAERAGIAASALRFYEAEGLVHAHRNESGHRRYPAEVLRRIGFIRAAALVGLSLAEIKEALQSLPDQRTPTAKDWAALARSWQPQIEQRIELLTALRDSLAACIGCGCLSLSSCRLWNPGDAAADLGHGPRYLISDERPPGAGRG